MSANGSSWIEFHSRAPAGSVTAPTRPDAAYVPGASGPPRRYSTMYAPAARPARVGRRRDDPDLEVGVGADPLGEHLEQEPLARQGCASVLARLPRVGAITG